MIQNGKFVADCISSGIDKDIQTQPAGFDLTVESIEYFTCMGGIMFNDKRLPEIEKVTKGTIYKFGISLTGYYLPKGTYKIIFNEVVSIPKDCVAIGFPRSSILRAGCDIRTALWDPGYVGRSEALLVVHNERGVVIGENARVMQLVMNKIENPTTKYSGAYQCENLGNFTEKPEMAVIC